MAGGVSKSSTRVFRRRMKVALGDMVKEALTDFTGYGHDQLSGRHPPRPCH
jgi:hypothetical protein